MRKIAIIMVLLACSALPGRAQRETSAFVGHYGHTLMYTPDWAVTARMIGDAEEIRFHQRRLYSASDSAPFQPKSEDFKVPNYTPLRLMSLLVVPRKVSSFDDMSELKEAKIADLEGTAEFRIIPDPAPIGYWPEGTFEVRISTPYRLRQLYTFNDNYRFILTWGEDENGTLMSDASGRLKTSLSKFMASPAAPDPRMEQIEETMTQEYLLERGRRMRRFLAGLTAVLIAAFLASGRLLGVRFFLRGILGSAALCAVGAAALGAFLENTGSVRGWSQPLVAISSLILWIPAAVRLSTRNGERFHYVAPILSALATAGLYLQAVPGYQVSGLDVFACAFTGFFAGSIAWILSWVFSIGLRRTGIIPLAGLLFIGIGSHNSHAATPESILFPRDVVESKAWANLAERGINKDNIRTEARNRLRAAATDEPIYDYQSVEMAGVGANDDTEKILPKAFDLKLMPSARARRSRIASAAIPWIEALANYQQDARDAKKEIDGVLSNAGKSSLAPLIDQEVNRIIAHSWGTEIIYNAIFFGIIKPPRVLIVLGPPDRNAEKWRILAERTGTKVMVYRADGDPVPEVGGMFKSALPTDPVLLNEMWDSQCATIDCKPHPLRRGDYQSKLLLNLPGHGRKLYYDRLKEMGVVGSNLLEVQMSQEDRITAASESILESAIAEAQEAMRISREESIARTDGTWREAAIVQARPIPDGPKIAPAVGIGVGVGVDRARMLRSLAIGACTQPEAVNNGVVGNINFWFPNRDLPDAAKIGSGLNGCAAQLYQELLEASRTWDSGRKLTVEWVKMRADSLSHPKLAPSVEGSGGGGRSAPPDPDHGRVWDKIGPIIR